MAEKIRLVQGDNLPRVVVELADQVSGDPIDLTQLDAAVLKFRAAGGSGVLAVLPMLVVDAEKGALSFGFPGATLDVPAGDYEGEIEMDFGGDIQTLYELLKFKVRPQF